MVFFFQSPPCQLFLHFLQLMTWLKCVVSAACFLFLLTTSHNHTWMTNQRIFGLLISCQCRSSLRLDSQRHLEVLINHVADAHRRNDLHEVGRQTSVESHRSFGSDDVFEQARHVHLRASFHSSWKHRGKHSFQLLQRRAETHRLAPVTVRRIWPLKKWSISDQAENWVNGQI